MNVRARTPLRLVEPVSAEVRDQGWRIVHRDPHSLLGPQYLITDGEAHYWVGELTLDTKLRRGWTPKELELYPVDPEDAAPEYPEEDRRCSIADRIIRARKEQI